MSLTDIQTKIISDAETKKENIIAGASTKATSINLASEEQKDELSKKASSELKKTKQSMERITLSEADQKVRSSIARAREEKIKEAFTNSLEALQKLNDADYATLIKGKLSEIDLAEITTIETPDACKDIIKKSLGDTKIDIISNSSISGGFIASGKTVHYDFSFENLLKNARETLTVDVSRTLFKN